MSKTDRVIWPDEAEACDARGQGKRRGGKNPAGGSKGPCHLVAPITDAEALGRAFIEGEEIKPKRGGSQKLTPARVREAIWKYAGVVSHAAQALGVTRQAFYKHLHAHPSLIKDLHEARETYPDIAESHIVWGIRSGNVELSRRYLQTKWRYCSQVYQTNTGKRGYTSLHPRQELLEEWRREISENIEVLTSEEYQKLLYLLDKISN